MSTIFFVKTLDSSLAKSMVINYTLDVLSTKFLVIAALLRVIDLVIVQGILGQLLVLDKQRNSFLMDILLNKLVIKVDIYYFSRHWKIFDNTFSCLDIAFELPVNGSVIILAGVYLIIY